MAAVASTASSRSGHASAARARGSIESLWVICLGAVLSACAPDSTTIEAQLIEVRSLRQAGEHAVAIEIVRNLIREQPEQAELRLLLGNLYLESGDGAAAESAYRRALNLGHQTELRLELGRSFLLQQKYTELLALIPPVAELRDDELELMLLRSEAELRLGHLADLEMLRAFVRLYRLLDALPQSAAARSAAVQESMEKLRAEFPIVDRGWQHYRCSSATPAETDIADPDAAAVQLGRRLLRVGPTRRLKAPSIAAREAQDGDLIEIDAGIYENDVAVWTQNNLVLRSVGGRAHMKSDGLTADDKGIWVLEGNDTVVEGMEFSGAKSTFRNGSGIRLLGSGATIRHSFFHDNEDGVLGGRGPDSDVLIEYSEFANNGFGDGQSHNIYIGAARSFTLRFSYSHGSHVGHLVKSRAFENNIQYNRLADGPSGDSSYILDLPDGGYALVIGNELQQNHLSLNGTMLSFGAESADRPNNALYVVHNTFHNQRLRGTFIRNHTSFEALVLNNIFSGAPGVILRGAGGDAGSLLGAGLGLIDPQAYEFGLTADSPAIDAGLPIPPIDDNSTPTAEYVHPAGGRARQNVWAIDIGAHEFCGYY